MSDYSGGDLVARHALAAHACDALDHLWHLWRRRLAQALGPRAAILQADQAFVFETIMPFAAGARANACGFTGGLRRLAAYIHGIGGKVTQTGIAMLEKCSNARLDFSKR